MAGTPQYLLVGHCCHDRHDDRNTLGGTVSYAALVARQLGQETAVLTSTGPDFEFMEVFRENGIEVKHVAAPRTTVFENIYRESNRTQYLHARASTLLPEHVPDQWRAAPVVQFCPIADEVDFSLLRAFPGSLTAATIQGWLRQWDRQGLVSPKPMDWPQLKGLDIVVMSDADIAGFESAIPIIASCVKILVMTEGANGARVFYDGRQQHFPAFPVTEVDATGAGDVFATSFVLRYAQTRDMATAAVFANAAASFVVEGAGMSRLPTWEMIEERERGGG